MSPARARAAPDRRARRVLPRMREALGDICRPAPTSASRRRLLEDIAGDAMAGKRERAVRPAMPAPMIATCLDGMPWFWSAESGGLDVEDAAGRVGLVGLQRRIVAVKRRAVGADLLVVVAHVDEDMRMVEGNGCAGAHEFLDADLDRRGIRRRSGNGECCGRPCLSPNASDICCADIIVLRTQKCSAKSAAMRRFCAVRVQPQASITYGPRQKGRPDEPQCAGLFHLHAMTA